MEFPVRAVCRILTIVHLVALRLLSKFEHSHVSHHFRHHLCRFQILPLDVSHDWPISLRDDDMDVYRVLLSVAPRSPDRLVIPLPGVPEPTENLLAAVLPV